MKQETTQKLYMYGIMIAIMLGMAGIIRYIAYVEPVEEPIGVDLQEIENVSERFDWKNSKSEYLSERTYATKDFQHPTDSTKRIKIQSLGLLHYYDNSFKDIVDLPFPEGKEISTSSDKHFMLNLPEWGNVKVEDNGEKVRVYDKKGQSIYVFKNPIVVEKGTAPYEIQSLDNLKIRDSFDIKEKIDFEKEKIVTKDIVDEVVFEVENNKLYLKLPEILKNKYPLQAYDATDTGSTDNKDAMINKDGTTTNTGAWEFAYIDCRSLYSKRIVFDWTLSSGSGEISDVELLVYSSGAGSYSGTINAHTLTQSFTEGIGEVYSPPDSTSDVSWANYTGSTAWSTAGGDYSGTVIDSATWVDTIGWEPALVLMGAAATNPLTLDWESNFLLLIKDSVENGSAGNVMQIHTKENASNKPYLEITYTPAPPVPEDSGSQPVIWFD